MTRSQLIKALIVGAVLLGAGLMFFSAAGCAHVKAVAAACAEPVTEALTAGVTGALDGDDYEVALAKLGVAVLPCALEAAVREVVAAAESVKASGPKLSIRAGRGHVWLAERAIGQGQP